MDKRDPCFVRDVEELLEETVMEEAVSAVWEVFKNALETIDQESRQLLELHFQGKTANEIALRLDVSENEVREWIIKSKRDVIKKINEQTKVRQ